MICTCSSESDRTLAVTSEFRWSWTLSYREHCSRVNTVERVSGCSRNVEPAGKVQGTINHEPLQLTLWSEFKVAPGNVEPGKCKAL